jgi:hypothetical protein
MGEASEGNKPLAEVVSIEGNAEDPISEGLGAPLVTQFQSLLINMADAAVATFSALEWERFYAGCVDSGDRYVAITGILRDRVPSLEQA